jgi:hypothetical protein
MIDMPTMQKMANVAANEMRSSDTSAYGLLHVLLTASLAL